MRLTALLLTAAFVPAVQAQEPSLYQARQLLAAGQASAALQILEGVAQTRDAMEWRAAPTSSGLCPTNIVCGNINKAVSVLSKPHGCAP
jgi:hypothetical protein